jgi:hypothetical protein
MGGVMGLRDVVLRIRSSRSLMPATVMALSLAVFLFVAHATPAVAQSMAIPGKFDVGGSGAAAYSIPIAVPPGTAGMTPALALGFSSQGSNGIVGMGWSLSGLPSINRCPQTFAHDGVRGGVNFDSNDRFCMDGQRLMVISGAYGADGAEYRTEIESFVRVISHGTAGTGPAWFEVHTKSGQIMEFGYTVDSLVLAQGKPTARSWAVNKVSDTKGNYYTVTYTNDTVNGQAYPVEIDYSGNAAAGLAPYNKVQFVYATRPDITPAYQAGSLVKTTVRLTNVQTYAGTNLVMDYRLAYDATITSLSSLTSVTACAADGSCLPPTSFTATSGSGGTFNAGTFTYPYAWNIGQPTNWTPIVGDFNGDGKTDFAFSSGTGLDLFLSNGDGTFTASSFTYPYAWSFGQPTNWTPIVGDFNGDGKTDFAFSSGTGLDLFLSNGDGTFTASSFTYPYAWNFGMPPSSHYTPIIGDFNGDGKTDFAFAGATYISTFQAGGPPIYQLNAVTNGLGATTAFTYQLLTNGNIYTKDTTSTYPFVDVQAPIYVVSRVDTSNGVGGTYSTTYSYAGAKADLSGRGFLGFRQVKATDPQTNIVATTNVRQDYPFIGLTSSATKVLGTQTLNSVINTYQFSNASGGTTVSTPSNTGAPYRVSVSQSVAGSSDLDGTAMPVVTTTSQYDAYGNPTQLVVSTPDGFSKTTTNTYTNDTVKWFLGRLTGATVTSTRP